MDNFTPEQYERFEAYRRHALPKQAVRKVMTHLFQPSSPNAHLLKSASCQVIQQSLGQQVSMPVAQIVAGFTKVFVGEIVEKGNFITHLAQINT